MAAQMCLCPDVSGCTPCAPAQWGAFGYTEQELEIHHRDAVLCEPTASTQAETGYVCSCAKSTLS